MYKVFNNDNLIILSSDDVLLGNYENKVRLENRKELDLFLKQYFNDNYLGDVWLFGYETEKMFKDFCSAFVNIEAAGGIVKNKEGEILFIKRLGVWDFPKGKIENGESPKDAALREVEEETGVENLHIIKDLKSTYHIYPHKENLVLKKTWWFEMQTDYGGILTPQENEDIVLAEWHKKEEAMELLNKSYRSLRDSFEDILKPIP